MTIRDIPMARLMRGLTIALLIVTCSGLSAVVAATHDHSADCFACDSGCPGSCDPHGRPPGPLCCCASPVVVAQHVATVIPQSVVTAMATFHINTTIPPSITSEGIFHPPRLFV